MDHFKFSIPLRIRVSDLNYAGHVGYQNFFSFFQEARMAYLDQLGFSERDIGGCGMIIAEAHCKYKQELHLNDTIEVWCAVRELKSKMFIMAYRITNGAVLSAEGLTKNLGYNPKTKTVKRLPEVFVQSIENFEHET
jgi:acyl-CoA thioester hydrolase